MTDIPPPNRQTIVSILGSPTTRTRFEMTRSDEPEHASFLQALCQRALSLKAQHFVLPIQLGLLVLGVATLTILVLTEPQPCSRLGHDNQTWSPDPETAASSEFSSLAQLTRVDLLRSVRKAVRSVFKPAGNDTSVFQDLAQELLRNMTSLVEESVRALKE